jgi:hypothetical protein
MYYYNKLLFKINFILKNPHSSRRRLLLCGMLIFKLHFSCTCNMFFFSKYVQSNNMLLSYRSLTFIYYYRYLCVV